MSAVIARKNNDHRSAAVWRGATRADEPRQPRRARARLRVDSRERHTERSREPNKRITKIKIQVSTNAYEILVSSRRSEVCRPDYQCLWFISKQFTVFASIFSRSGGTGLQCVKFFLNRSVPRSWRVFNVFHFQGFFRQIILYFTPSLCNFVLLNNCMIKDDKLF